MSRDLGGAGLMAAPNDAAGTSPMWCVLAKLRDAAVGADPSGVPQALGRGDVPHGNSDAGAGLVLWATSCTSGPAQANGGGPIGADDGRDRGPARADGGGSHGPMVAGGGRGRHEQPTAGAAGRHGWMEKGGWVDMRTPHVRSPSSSSQPARYAV